MKITRGNAVTLLDHDRLLSRDVTPPTPVTHGALGDPKGTREIGGFSGFGDGKGECIHRRHSAPEVHQRASGIVHRRGFPLSALSSAMEILILTESDHRRAVGDRLKRAIYAAKLNQVQAADIMGVTKNHLGNWIRGTAYPMHYPLYRFFRSTGVTADFVLLGDPSGLPKRIGDLILSDALAPVDQTAEPRQEA